MDTSKANEWADWSDEHERIHGTSDQHRMRPATWEGSVMPALRLACEDRPETRGATICLSGWNGTKAVYEARVEGHGFNRKGEIRADTAEHVTHDVFMLASLAACHARSARKREAETPPCPVCAAMPGWVCSQHRGPTAVPPEVLRDEAPQGLARAERDAIDLASRTMTPAEVWDSGAPAGFRFTMTAKHDQVYVERLGLPDVWQGEWLGAYYWGKSDRASRDANASGTRWPPHAEAARQHAARMLGQEAPPRRPAVKPRPWCLGERVETTRAHGPVSCGRLAIVVGQGGDLLILEFDNGLRYGFAPSDVRRLASPEGPLTNGQQ
jgi:hypothetical protein